MSKQETETVEVIIKLPKAVYDFIKDTEGNVEKYISREIVELTVSSVECLTAYNSSPEALMDKIQPESSLQGLRCAPKLL